MTGLRRPIRDGWVLTLACAGSFLVVMDATIVSVALPGIRSDLALSTATLPWVVNAYTLAFAGFLLLGGRVADICGARRTLVAGMALFTAFRVLAGLATDPAVLLAARAVQGVGGALLMPVTLALVTTTFTEPGRRAMALGTWSAVSAVGAALGPVLGGLLIAWGGWRWVFFVTVPVGVLAIVGARLLLPARTPTGRRPRLDLAGAVLGTAGLLGVIYAVMGSAAASWGQPQVWGPLVAGVALLGVFLVHQSRTAEPLLPLALFGHRSVSGGNAVMFLLGLGFFASPVLLSLYLQDVLGWSASAAGLGYLPVGVAMFVGARTAGPLTVRIGPRRTTVLCAATGGIGLAGMAAALGTDGSLVAVAIAAVVFGLGSAAAFTPVTVSATSGVHGDRSGVAAGVLNTVRQASGALGLAGLTAVAAAASGGTRLSGYTVLGYAVTFAVCAVCLALAAVLAAVAMPRDAAAGPVAGAQPATPGRAGQPIRGSGSATD